MNGLTRFPTCVVLSPDPSSRIKHGCMTDLLNQHPNSFPPAPVQQADRSCTPGVRRNDELQSYADCDSTSHADITPSPPFGLGQPNIDLDVALPRIPPSATSLPALDQTAVRLPESSPGEPAVTCQQYLTDVSSQNPPSHSQPPLLPEFPATCKPSAECKVRKNAAAIYSAATVHPGLSQITPYSSLCPVQALQHGVQLPASTTPVPSSRPPHAGCNTDAGIHAVASPNSLTIQPQSHPTEAMSLNSEQQLNVATVQRPSLNLPLERFKAKVRASAHIQNQQFLGTSSANYFQALQASDDDEDSDSEMPYHSDMDEEVEPLNMGYQSADGRSLSKNKKPSGVSSGQKINKRYPNVPLSAKLRSRKSLSTPIRLCL